MNKLGWKQYIDIHGNFELPSYLYAVNNSLMKETLDLGTLLSADAAKLRAYKEQIKKMFKKRWMDMAEALEFFDIVVPCVCSNYDYCEICGGSRYKLNAALTPDEMREVAILTGAGADVSLMEKLQRGLMKALKETNEL